MVKCVVNSNNDRRTKENLSYALSGKPDPLQAQ